MGSQFPAERVGVAFQGNRGQPLVLDDQLMRVVAVGAVIDAEVEAQLGLPAVPETLQDAVPGEIVEEPVESKVRVDAGRDVVLLHRPAQILDGLQQLRPLRTAQCFGRELGRVRLDT